MDENAISKLVISEAIQLHKALGPGLLESVYQKTLAYSLRNRGLEVEEQVSLAIRYEELVIPDAFRIDMIVNRKVILELKSIESIAPVHHKQLITYLRLSDLKLGLLLNFGCETMKEGVRRVINGNLAEA